MKHSTTPKRISIIALLVLVTGLTFTLIFYSCKKPTEGIKVIVSTGTLSKSPVLIHFTNANLASANQPGDFSVNVTGKDSALVQMDGGSIKYAASHGFLPLSLTRSAKPTTVNPITFNVTASVSGYVPITQTINITSDTAKAVFEIKLIEYANPAKGTSALVTTTNLNGGVSSAVNLTTPTNASVSQTATLSIPSGTQMLDANGAVINAGTLNSNIVQFTSGTPSLVNSFPGSMRANIALDKNGKLINGVPISSPQGCSRSI